MIDGLYDRSGGYDMIDEIGGVDHRDGG